MRSSCARPAESSPMLASRSERAARSLELTKCRQILKDCGGSELAALTSISALIVKPRILDAPSGRVQVHSRRWPTEEFENTAEPSFGKIVSSERSRNDASSVPRISCLPG